MLSGGIFLEISVVVLLAVVISTIAKLLRQPPIIGYIVAGILVSPHFLNVIKSTEPMSAFAQIGIAVLLFMVGLNLNPKVIKEVGTVALLLGAGQILLTIIFGFAIAKLFAFSTVASLLIGIALSFSSTIIIIKLLSDKGETQSLYGKISIGVLIVQDLVAILALMVLSSLNGSNSLASLATQKLGYGAGLVVALFLVAVYILPSVTKIIAKSQELLLLFSVGWALALASLFNYLGFSIEIGALLAGISLSISPYRYEIGAKMKPLRDFFLLIFFILLGTQTSFSNFSSMVWPIVAFSAFVFIGKPLIIMGILGRMGYTKRTGFLCGVTLSQISEFSFILLALATTVLPQHIPPEVASIITFVGIITIAASTYTIMHIKGLYRTFSNYLRFFERTGRKVDEGKYHRDEDYDIILFGYNRIGYSLKESFKRMKKKFLVVDNNPDTIQQLARIGVDCRYGDAEDLELLAELPLREAKMVISTIPELDTNLLLLKKLKRINRSVLFMAVSHQIEESLELYEAGANYVITPHFFGGTYTAHLLEKHGFSKEKFKQEGVKSAKELLKRKREGHKDPVHERD